MWINNVVQHVECCEISFYMSALVPIGGFKVMIKYVAV